MAGDNDCCGVKAKGIFFVVFELLCAATALAIGITWLTFSLDQSSYGYGKYPYSWSRATDDVGADKIADGKVNLGVLFFGWGLLVAGGSLLIMMIISVIRYNTESCMKERNSEKTVSPLAAYVDDMENMTNWFDGIRHALTVWVFFYCAFAACGNRDFVGLFLASGLAIVSYLLRVACGWARVAYGAERGGYTELESADSATAAGASAARKKGLRSLVSWLYLLGLAIQVTLNTLLFVAFSFRTDDSLEFTGNAQGFVLVVGIITLVEYYLVFSMRTSVVLKDVKGSDFCGDAMTWIAWTFSLAGLWGVDCLQTKKHRLGWISYVLSRGMEIALWSAGSYLLYDGLVKNVTVVA